MHHDIWDYDINSAPTLMDITVDGEEIPALMQATKMGFLFVVNRETGEDVWPIEERPVPQGDGNIEGEELCPTQPFPTKPTPLLDQSQNRPEVWWIADLLSASANARALWDNARYEGMYTPPTTEGSGALAYPRPSGGVQWGGVGLRSGEPDRDRQHPRTSSRYIKLYEREEYDEEAGGSGNESGFYPQKGAPYGCRARQCRSTGSACPAGSRPSASSSPST